MIGGDYFNVNRFSIWQGGSERLTVQGYGANAGFVGIGKSSPTSNLHVEGAPANGVYLSYLYNSGTHNSSHGLNVQTASSNEAAYGLRVNTGGNSNALAVKGNGYVGIGTGTPTSYNSHGRNLVVAGGGNAGITIDGAATSSCSICFADGTSSTASIRRSPSSRAMPSGRSARRCSRRRRRFC